MRMYNNDFGRDERGQGRRGGRGRQDDFGRHVGGRCFERDGGRGYGRRSEGLDSGEGGRRGGGRRGREGFGPERGGPAGPGRGGHHEHGGHGGPGRGPDHGGRGGRGGRGRARRGDVRIAALLLISEEPRNGYQIIQTLSERSDGAWRVSSGAIYPALSQLEDEGLIRATEVEGRKAFEITEDGKAKVAERGEAPKPWERAAEEQARSGGGELAHALRQLMLAGKAIEQSGDPEIARAAAAVLEDARRSLYRLLADGPEAPAES